MEKTSSININAKNLDAIKDEVFARFVKKQAEHSVRTVLHEYAEGEIFCSNMLPRIYGEVTKDGYAWIGNDTIRVRVHLETFQKSLEAEVASQI